ncbi:MAG: hypothetical protein LBH13_08895 [Cellulomonadaceae bacterium]|jgi:hypothetical protein|nr:hypothetical protein [Cellulomonadaceae bacterium]
MNTIRTKAIALTVAIACAIGGVAVAAPAAAKSEPDATVTYKDFNQYTKNTRTLSKRSYEPLLAEVANKQWDNEPGYFSVRIGSVTGKYTLSNPSAWFFYFVEKNEPAVNIKVGKTAVKAKCMDVYLAPHLTPKATRVDIDCALKFTDAQYKKFVKAIVNLKHGGKIVYSFRTPKLAAKGITKDDAGKKYTIAYKGVSALSNKKIKVTETIYLPKAYR